MGLNPENERRLRRNWTLLKQDLKVEECVQKFVERGVFPPHFRNDIRNVIPNTQSMKAEKFLNAVIASGSPGFQTLCSILRDDQDNRYSLAVEALGITERDITPEGASCESRPSTGLSSASSGTVNSETGERTRRVQVVTREDNHHPHVHVSGAPVAAVAPVMATPRGRPTGPVEHRPLREQADSAASSSEVSLPMVQGTQASASGGASNLAEGNGDVVVDMKALEDELVRIAPTIAELFQKISKQTRNIPTSEEEIQRVKEENERLRKTNKSLIEKLNIFQQKIIQLQIDNKRLKENGDEDEMVKDALKKKTDELQLLEKRLDEHKKALEEKEVELNVQLLKLQEIEEENEMQREKIDKLEEMQDEGIFERNIQQEQISSLVEEKEKQKDQIESLEEQQKMGEQRLYRLEERLKLLEQGPRRQGRGRRMVSPPRNNGGFPSNNGGYPNNNHNVWMNGFVDRSHHANVKLHADIKFSTERETRPRFPTSNKGWSFS